MLRARCSRSESAASLAWVPEPISYADGVSRVRNLVADILVGIVLLIVLWWFLRGVLGLILWVVNVVAFVAVIIVLLAIANRVRGK